MDGRKREETEGSRREAAGTEPSGTGPFRREAAAGGRDGSGRRDPNGRTKDGADPVGSSATERAAAPEKPAVAIVCDKAMAAADPVVWSAGYLAERLQERGLRVIADAGGEAARAADTDMDGADNGRIDAPQGSGAATLTVVLTAIDSPLLRDLGGTGAMPERAEAFVLRGGARDGRRLLVAAGTDVRGLMYAALELADRVRCADDPLAALLSVEDETERPVHAVRSVTRIFSSEPEDKDWFCDRDFWSEYLTELAMQRFNRFSLGVGLGYDYGNGNDWNVIDNYLCFPFPFLFDVPGYEARAMNVTAEEQSRNLAALRYVSEETRRRGMHFQLGLWTMAYDYPHSPQLRYPVQGLTGENFADYCRDALRSLLERCPAIGGLTLRVHGEGGSFDSGHRFWRTVLEGAALCGRPVEIDMHAKGVDAGLIEAGLETRLPIIVSPKYSSEHMGLPYHQAAIREIEFDSPHTSRLSPEIASVRQPSRRFTRYGYGDYLRKDRAYGIVYRVWPGTQRLLLWGDPALAAGYGREAGFGGALGLEICEPLTFKARKGSGTPGGREPYAAEELRQGTRGWRKYKLFYRLWGRHLYDPEANPESWRRYYRAEFGEAAEACERALASASRILPLITTAYHPSAANNHYWPEMYWNLPIVRTGMTTSPYDKELRVPRTFGSASPLDPVLFYGVNEFADDVAKGRRSGKYSPLDTADRLEGLAAETGQALDEAAAGMAEPGRPEYRRLAVDAAALAGLGSFFAGKLRAGLAFALYERTGEPELLARAVAFYNRAREGWLRVIAATDGIYRDDLTFGQTAHARGHWKDRLKLIDDDIRELQRQDRPRERGAEAPAGHSADRRSAALPGEHEASGGEGTGTPRTRLPAPGDPDGAAAARARAVFARTSPPCPAYRHTPQEGYRAGQPATVAIDLPAAEAAGMRVYLHYRSANHAEAYVISEMERQNGRFVAEIPASYTAMRSAYALIYFFEVEDEGRECAWMIPGLAPDLANRPYFVLDSEGSLT